MVSSELNSAVMDIEDLVKAGIKHTFCPYFATKGGGASQNREGEGTNNGEGGGGGNGGNDLDVVDLVLMPYNYIVDEQSRKAFSLDWKRAIVIFDEAHNIEQVL
jgi:Rad3-related DNA helicase